MTDPMEWVDESTARVVLAVPAVGEADLLRWVEVLRAGAEGGDPNEWSEFRVRTGGLAVAEGFEAAAIAGFFDTAAADGGYRTVTALLDLGDRLPAVFVALRQPPVVPAEDPAGEYLAWIKRRPVLGGLINEYVPAA